MSVMSEAVRPLGPPPVGSSPMLETLRELSERPARTPGGLYHRSLTKGSMLDDIKHELGFNTDVWAD